MSSQEIICTSPITFHVPTAEVAKRGDWEVVLAYQGEGEGPWLVDLSHRSKWDIQDGSLDALKPFEKDIPPAPGNCALTEGWLINRMNRTQAALWDLDAEEPWTTSVPPYATETTAGLCLLAMMGKNLFALMEKLTSLDLAAPNQKAPYLVQGPILHIPCQVVVLDNDASPVVLTAFSRGYGQTMAHAILESGRDLGLRPSGEKRFSRHMKNHLG